MIVKPVPGRRVRDPVTLQILTAESDVPDNAYWRRRLNEGDLVLVLPEAPVKENTK